MKIYFVTSWSKEEAPETDTFDQAQDALDRLQEVSDNGDNGFLKSLDTETGDCEDLATIETASKVEFTDEGEKELKGKSTTGWKA